jgi:hypothetical protein
MGETSSEIKHRIDEERRSLGENLSELEYRAKHAVDWRSRVRRNPLAALGIAVGAGAIVGALSVRSQTTSASSVGWRSESQPEPRPEPRVSGFARSPAWTARKKKLGDTLDTVTDAIVGMAATRVKDFLGSLVPGLDTHLQRAERDHRNSSDYSSA